MTEPMPFQREDVDQIHAWRGRALIAWTMGLGKTFGAWLYVKESAPKRTVILCPASLKLHWQAQGREHFGLRSSVLYGTKPNATLFYKKKRVLILNYDILHGWVKFLRSYRPECVIADECHYLGNLQARRTRAFRRLCEGVPHVLALSGTPLTNRPWEMFPTLNVLRPDLFDSPFSYGMKFCEATREFGRWKFRGARNLPELHETLIENMMVRRTKEEVLKELPPITRSVVPLELSTKAMEEYREAEADLIAWLAKTDVVAARKAAWSEGLAKWTHMRKLIITLKLPKLFDWIDDFLKESEGKLLFGVHHKLAVRALHERYKGISVVIDGSKTARQRLEAEQAYRKKGSIFRMLIGNIKSAGVGLNLPETSMVGVGELPWTPGDCLQFENRAHRLNTEGPVSACYLVAHKTLEAKICKILQGKMRSIDLVLDGVSQQDQSLTLFEILTEVLSER